jgi:hypothetical protein
MLMTATGVCTVPTGPPVLLAPVVAGNNVLLSWTAPATGGAVDAYMVGAGSATGTANVGVFDTRSTATSLGVAAANGTYFVRIAGRNACGIGAPSNEVSFTLGPVVPGTPSGLGFTLGSGGLVTLTWNAPASGGAPTSYVVEAGSATGMADLAVLATGSPSTTLAVKAPPGTYVVRVRAANGAGAGASSNEVTVRVP